MVRLLCANVTASSRVFSPSLAMPFSSQPLKRNVESSFRTDGVEMLKIRNDNMAENALRAASEAVFPFL